MMLESIYIGINFNYPECREQKNNVYRSIMAGERLLIWRLCRLTTESSTSKCPAMSSVHRGENKFWIHKTELIDETWNLSSDIECLFHYEQLSREQRMVQCWDHWNKFPTSLHSHSWTSSIKVKEGWECFWIVCDAGYARERDAPQWT